MDSPTSLHRRRLLGSLAGATVLGALAGCTGDSDDSANGASTDGPEPGDEDDGSSTAGSPDADGSGNGSDDGDDPSDDGDDSSENDSGDGESDDRSGDVPPADDLDLREANVVGVEFDADGGSYGFDVTLHHDDDGEDGYANWWQIERLDGSRLGRRDLLHAHSRQPFTRSSTIDVPGDVTCVVVRGHDQTHGYGGVAMLVDLDAGTVRPVDQSAEQQSFEEADCP